MSADRVAFVGDARGKASWLGYVIRQVVAAGAGQLVQLGDFGLWPGPGGVDFLDEVERHLERHDAELVFVDGNHDWHERRLQLVPESDGLVTLRPRLRYAPRGTVFELAGQRVLAIGGAPSIDQDLRTQGVDWWPEEIVSYADASRCIEAGPVDVVVAHDCPSEVDLVGLSPWAPGEAHRKLMSVVLASARPRWWFSGHYHVRGSQLVEHREGFSTRVEILDCDQSTSSGRGWVVVDAEALARHGDDPAVQPLPGSAARRIVVGADVGS